MERSEALRRLPLVHAEAIELADQGLDAHELARLLGIDTSAVGPLLRIARAKLAAIETMELSTDPVEVTGEPG
jgi:DNA-directed RNA polymerase specialized sigma24 family protein